MNRVSELEGTDVDLSSEKDDEESATKSLSESGDSEPCKRGSRPRPSDAAKRRKLSNPFCQVPVSELKKTSQPFLQYGPCDEAASKLGKCRECRSVAGATLKTSNCRFYAFRKLRYSKTGSLMYAGFSDPHSDPSEKDLKVWLGDDTAPPADLDVNQSRFLLEQMGDQFCELWHQEQKALEEHLAEDGSIGWKRVVNGIRELCDVCETTLFNYHWTCRRCGFAVCIDCYRGRKYGEVKIWNNKTYGRDEFFWLVCSNRATHVQSKLLLTQIIADESMKELAKRLHEARALWNIPEKCGCLLSRQEPSKESLLLYGDVIRAYSSDGDANGSAEGLTPAIKESAVKTDSANGLREVKAEPKKQLLFCGATYECDSDSSSSSDDHESALQQLLTLSASNDAKPNTEKAESDSHHTGLKPTTANTVQTAEKNGALGRSIPNRIMTLSSSTQLYPTVPHKWLCDGRMLCLLNPMNPGNLKMFQGQWKLGQPVIVSDVIKNMNADLWTPQSFSKDFGEEANDLINCLTGGLVPNQPMKRFWDGFDFINKRIKDEHGQPMLLKLKDWPPGEDFAVTLPAWFNDLMKALPLGEYTKRQGKFNLTSHLPECFVKPDLGPKMYNAYGSALYPTKGTTNLHLDISDAVNVMVYVSTPKDTNMEHVYIEEAYKAVEEAGCDTLTRHRVREQNVLPGAIWHIYPPRDADKIRDLLNKVSIERGERIEPNHDAIHDQSWYLDSTLRERLYREYGVEGYPIAQCLGDAVFIPAGAPHQVRNLHNCIKVAEDFVSPENVQQCFKLTHEFRALTDTHANHEDKLQIKNLIYHAVKDSLACLSEALHVLHADNTSCPEIKEDKLSTNTDGSIIS